jgi:hypothetical protein
MTKSRSLHALAAFLMAAYAANVLAGRAGLLTGTAGGSWLGDVGEFLVVLASITCFVSGILAAEATTDTHNAAAEAAADEGGETP